MIRCERKFIRLVAIYNLQTKHHIKKVLVHNKFRQSKQLVSAVITSIVILSFGMDTFFMSALEELLNLLLWEYLHYF